MKVTEWHSELYEPDSGVQVWDSEVQETDSEVKVWNWSKGTI